LCAHAPSPASSSRAAPFPLLALLPSSPRPSTPLLSMSICLPPRPSRRTWLWRDVDAQSSEEQHIDTGVHWCGSDDPWPTNPRSRCRGGGGGESKRGGQSTAPPRPLAHPVGLPPWPALLDAVAGQQCHPPSMEVASHSLLQRRMHPTAPHLCLMSPGLISPLLVRGNSCKLIDLGILAC
jgi:hypothetical protein